MFIGFLTPDWRCGKDILMKRLNGVLGQVCFGLTKVEIWSCSILIAAMLALAIANDVRAGENTFIVGFPEDNMANDWRAAQVRELASELAKHSNIRFLQSDAGGQISRNLQDIEDMVDAGAKLLFLGPRDSKLLTPVVKKLHGQGIHIVLLTRRIESNDFDSYISPNDFNIARAAGAYLGKHLGGKGRVLMRVSTRAACRPLALIIYRKPGTPFARGNNWQASPIPLVERKARASPWIS
jgi:ABC-type sugar transport system substrate-binding protein